MNYYSKPFGKERPEERDVLAMNQTKNKKQDCNTKNRIGHGKSKERQRHERH